MGVNRSGFGWRFFYLPDMAGDIGDDEAVEIGGGSFGLG